MYHLKVGTLMLADLLLGALVQGRCYILLNDLFVLLQFIGLHVDVSLELFLVDLILLLCGWCDISVAILLNLIRRDLLVVVNCLGASLLTLIYVILAHFLATVFRSGLLRVNRVGLLIVHGLTRLLHRLL